MIGDAWTDADPTVCPICGKDSCDDPAHLPPVQDHATAPQAPTPTLTFQSAQHFITAPRPIEIVEGIAWARCVTVFVAESGGSKTFVLFDLAAAVSSNVAWFDRSIVGGSVAYCSFEGDALGPRLRAIRDHKGYRLDDIHIVRASDPISPKVTREGEERSAGERHLTEALTALVAKLRTTQRPPLRLLVIDTVRASLIGSEDNSEHTAAYLRVVRRLLGAVPDAASILAHHSGWQDGDTPRKRERGSSAWRGNSDAVFYLEAGTYDVNRGECPITLRTLKVRDVEPPPPLYLMRRRVELAEMAAPHDPRRGPVTSCVIERDARTREDREADRDKAKHAEQIETDLQVLHLLVAQAVTSQQQLRIALAFRRDRVEESLARLLRRGWVTAPTKQRQPYTLTAAGLAALKAAGLEAQV